MPPLNPLLPAPREGRGRVGMALQPFGPGATASGWVPALQPVSGTRLHQREEGGGVSVSTFTAAGGVSWMGGGWGGPRAMACGWGTYRQGQGALKREAGA